MSSSKKITATLVGAAMVGLLTGATPALAAGNASAERSYLEARADTLRSASDTYLTEAKHDEEIAKQWHAMAVHDTARLFADLLDGRLSASERELSVALAHESVAERAVDVATDRLTHARRAARIAARLEHRAANLTVPSTAEERARHLEELARIDRETARRDLDVARIERGLADEYRREAVRDLSHGDGRAAHKALRERAQAVGIAHALSSEASLDRSTAERLREEAAKLEQCSMITDGR